MGHKVFTAYFNRPQRRQVLRILLAVNHCYVVCATKCHQCAQRYFGSIGLVRKHRLPKHHAAQIDAIQPARQLAVYPGFNTVRVARPVQVAISLHHIWNNPRAGLASTRLVSACLNDAFKIMINPYSKPLRIYKMTQTFT